MFGGREGEREGGQVGKGREIARTSCQNDQISQEDNPVKALDRTELVRKKKLDGVFFYI